MNQNEFALHQSKQSDLKQFLQVLTPFALGENVPEDIKSMALNKVRELIPQITAGIKESPIQRVSSLTKA